MTLQQVVVLVLQASVVLTVFGFGLQATVRDTLYLVRHPGLLARSLVAMFVVMPVVAVILGEAFQLRRPVEIVLIALAISPVPPLLPGKQGKADGHAAYGLSLMAIISLLAIVIVPVWVEVLERYVGREFAMPPAAIARVVVLMTLLPLATGVAVRALLPAVTERIAKPIKLVATVSLLAGVLALLIAIVPKMNQLIGAGTLAAMAAFVAVGLTVGHWLGGPNGDEATVLALSTATRHPAIALAVAKVNVPDEPLLGATVVLYVLVAAVLSLPYIVRQRKATRAEAS